MKARLGCRATVATIGVALFALAIGPLSAASAAGRAEAGRAAQPRQAGQAETPDGKSGLVMVLDSSGSMADDDGTGRTRMESARTAVGTVVDALPDGFPTGLRVYGADRPKGCTDTRLARPVRPLDRAAMKQAVGAVRPKGDTPIGLSLRKAAQDLPKSADGAIGTRTILLISDGEDNCGSPSPARLPSSSPRTVSGCVSTPSASRCGARHGSSWSASRRRATAATTTRPTPKRSPASCSAPHSCPRPVTASAASRSRAP